MGQPELRATLARPDLRQLAQRITARFHLGPLSRSDTAAYVLHRLEVAGCQETVFPPSVLGSLHALSGGVPRMVNILCDRALLGGFVQGMRRVDRRTLRQAAREVSGETGSPGVLRGWRVGLAVAGAAVVLALVAALVVRREMPGAVAPWTPPAASTAPEPPSPAPPPVAPPSSTRSGASPLALPEALTEDAAFSALFGLWGVAYAPGEGNPCAQALVQGLACLRGDGGLDQVRRFDRPAVLALSDAHGNRRYVTLSGVQGDRWALAAAGGRMTVDGPSLSGWTPGGFTLLWRTPIGNRGAIAAGEHGPPVAWLEGRLARALGRPREPRPDPVYDAATSDAVRQFQRSAGLAEDGIAGPQTLLLLDREPVPGTPTLRGGG
jgi:general secretion pathway protein A